MTDERFCFVVCPIGDPGSPTRKRSNGILHEVIEPVAEGHGYRVERADHDKGPGIVTDKIVRKIIESDLVVADLHQHNPNVMYEVAIRHAKGKPIIQMIPENEDLPFDIGGLNTIEYDASLEGLGRFREHLDDAITAVEEGEGGENPVSRATTFQALEARGGTIEQALAQILEKMETFARGPDHAQAELAQIGKAASSILARALVRRDVGLPDFTISSSGRHVAIEFLETGEILTLPARTVLDDSTAAAHFVFEQAAERGLL